MAHAADTLMLLPQKKWSDLKVTAKKSVCGVSLLSGVVAKAEGNTNVYKAQEDLGSMRKLYSLVCSKPNALKLLEVLQIQRDRIDSIYKFAGQGKVKEMNNVVCDMSSTMEQFLNSYSSIALLFL